MSTYGLLANLLFIAGLFWICPVRLRHACLLAVSLTLTLQDSWKGLAVLVAVILTNWAGGRFIARLKTCSSSRVNTKVARHRIRALSHFAAAAVLLFDFGILALLKYFPSAGGSLLARAFTLIGRQHSGSVGLPQPAGLSFFIFMAAGYILDIAGDRVPAERSVLRFALFIGYYPQLVQGPISRYAELAPQFSGFDPRSLDDARRGLLRMLWGLFKKKVVADRAVLLVTSVFDGPRRGGALSLAGVLFYSLQQYADFSGGIDLVLGASEIMGFRLPENFRQPYFAVSLADFWRRWHITLGSWMRDYVFYPFALSRPVSAITRTLKRSGHRQLSRTLPAALGNVLIFVLVGLWHGASSHFIAWGLYNGILLALSALLFPRAAQKTPVGAGKILRILRTFAVVNIGWFFDRSHTAVDAFARLGDLFLRPEPFRLVDGTLLKLGLSPADFLILGASALLIFFISLLRECGTDVRGRILALPLAARWVLCGGFFTAVILLCVTNTDGGFLYAMY